MIDRRLPRPAEAGTMAVAVAAVIAVIGCEPRVTVEPPKEPITINVNVKIDHQIRVKVDSELEDLFAKKPELF
jgi:hypothetical protein